jgi:hypothetical protein
MKKILLTLSLLLVTNSVYAEWMHVGDTSEASYYVDIKTKKEFSNYTKMWTLTDWFELPQDTNDFYYSSANHQKFDCLNKSMQLQSSITYTLHKGKGDPLRTSRLMGNIIYPPPNSIGERMLAIACNTGIK